MCSQTPEQWRETVLSWMNTFSLPATTQCFDYYYFLMFFNHAGLTCSCSFYSTGVCVVHSCAGAWKVFLLLWWHFQGRAWNEKLFVCVLCWNGTKYQLTCKDRHPVCQPAVTSQRLHSMLLKTVLAAGGGPTGGCTKVEAWLYCRDQIFIDYLKIQVF